MSTDYSEDMLVEQPAIALFSELGYETGNYFCTGVANCDVRVLRAAIPQRIDEVILRFN